MSGSAPRTVEDLQQALAAMGRRPDAIGRDEDPHSRRDEDAMLLRRRGDGRVELVVRGRGFDRSVTPYDNEGEAIAHAAEDLLAPPNTDVRVRTPEERRRDAAAAQEAAREALAKLEAAKRDPLVRRPGSPGGGRLVRFEDDFIWREQRFSIGRAVESGRYYVSIPVSNGIVDYEEYYEIDAATHDAYLAEPSTALTFVQECRADEHDDLLIQKPGWGRGTPV